MRSPSVIVQQLTARRRELGVSQLGLASGLGTTQGALSQWERGVRQPRLDMVADWAAELDLRLVLAQPDAIAVGRLLLADAERVLEDLGACEDAQCEGCPKVLASVRAALKRGGS